MKKIGLISDTHSFLDTKVKQYFVDCDEVWHAGDIGDIAIIDELQAFKKSRIVWGNIDDHRIRATVPEYVFFEIEKHQILIIHIAGKFGSYTPQVRALIKQYRPSILVCGHSHILKIAFDKQNNLLYLNPGAYGISGFHPIRTMLRFTIEDDKISNMEIIETDRKAI